MVNSVNPTKDLVADMRAADRITRKTYRTMAILVGIFIIAFAGFYVYTTQRSDHELKQLINQNSQNSKQRITNLQNELRAIKENQNETKDELNQQTQYFTCIISLVTQGRYPTDLASCPAPAGYVAPTTSSQSKTSAPTSSSTNKPAQSAQTPAPKGNPNPPVTVPTPPKQPSLVSKILKFLGL